MMYRISLVLIVSACCLPVSGADDEFVREFENIAQADSIQIGAYYYPWYGADGRHWNEGVPREPALGEYESASELTINRHIDWATGHGVDFFAVSWWGPRSFEDDVLRNSFRACDLAGDIQFSIMYESTGRLRSRDGRIDFNVQGNRQQLADDFRYVARTYFDDPNYLRIGGRPVVFIYLTRIMTGPIGAAFDTARREVQEECGENVFIIADEVYWHDPDDDRISLFDGVTAYNMHTSSPDVAEWFFRELPGRYETWSKACRDAEVLFVPSVIPGFDDTAVRPEARHPVIPRSTQLFEEQLRLAIDLADEEQPLIMVNSWNEWHEDTAIEPALDYGFAYLEALRQMLRSR